MQKYELIRPWEAFTDHWQLLRAERRLREEEGGGTQT
jgi:hypothetical protein